MKQLFKNITTYVSKIEWTNEKEEVKKLKNIINSINENYLKELLGNRVINYYTDSDFIKSMINNYYKDIDTVYDKFNTSFSSIN